MILMMTLTFVAIITIISGKRIRWLCIPFLLSMSRWVSPTGLLILTVNDERSVDARVSGDRIGEQIISTGCCSAKVAQRGYDNVWSPGAGRPANGPALALTACRR